MRPGSLQLVMELSKVSKILVVQEKTNLGRLKYRMKSQVERVVERNKSLIRNLPKALARYWSIWVQYPIKWNSASVANTPTGTLTISFCWLISWRRIGCWLQQYFKCIKGWTGSNIASALKVAAIIDAVLKEFKWFRETIWMKNSWNFILSKLQENWS